MEDHKKKVETFLNEMNNYDPDLQEMGARYLSEFVQSGKINLKTDPELARKITSNFLKQVASTNFVVHSSAIRQLADMVPYIPKDELVHIFSETISAIAKINTPHERRQVFSTSAGTMIHHAPEELGIVISDLFVQSVNELLKAKTQKTQIQMLLLNVITEFVRKWPNVAGYSDVKYNRQALITHLIDNIENSPKLLLVRKSDGALSKLSITFNRQNFQLLLNHKNLSMLNFAKKYISSTDESGLKNLRNAILTLANICKVHNPELRPWVHEISSLAIQTINLHKDKDTYIQLETQIVESAITSLTYLLRGYAAEMAGLMKSGKLQSFLEECLNFDLQGMMNYITEEMQCQDEYEMEEEYFNEDTVCWKVRTAILRYITTLMHKDKVFKDNKAKTPAFLSLLTSKLIQQNQNVSKKAFQCFNYIIESISVSKDNIDLEQDFQLKRIKSSQSNFALDIISQISNQIQLLFKNTKTKQQVKTEASKTLLKIIELLKDRITQNQEINMKLLHLISSLIYKVKIDSCVNLIKALKSLLAPDIQFGEIQKIIKMLLEFTKNKNFKAVEMSFGTLRSIIKIYPDKLQKSPKLKDILDTILIKLKEHDADKLIKSSVIKCLGPIYRSLFLNLSEQAQNNILNSTVQKLQIQIDKGLILQQISQLNQNHKITNPQKPIFQKLLKQSSESLGSANFELNSHAIECCDKLIRIQLKNLSEKTVVDILNRSRPMINDHKIPKYIELLLDSHPKAFKNYVELITRTADIKYVVKIVEKKIQTKDSCIKTLRSIARAENSKNISVILGKLDVSEGELVKFIGDKDYWGIICVGALGYVGKENTSEYLLKLINGDCNEEVKLQAAKALGNIVSRYTNLIPKILDLAYKSQQNYLYIVALKEVIAFSTCEFNGFSDVLHFMFKISEESDRQTYQYIISQSIGKAAILSKKQLQSILSSIDKMSASRLFILASALRYSLDCLKSEEDMTPQLQKFIGVVANLIRHPDVNVRCAALKSLNSAAVTFKRYIMQSIVNQAFIEQLLDNMIIKPQLIVVIDYGVNKEKKDLGRPLRIQAFNFTKIVLEYSKIDLYTDQIIKICIDKIRQQTSNDLILKRVNLIKKISIKDYTAFIPHQNQFAKALGLQQGVLKAHQKQNQTDDERNQGYLKNLLKEIILIREISDQEGSDVIRALVNQIKTNQRLNLIMENIENQK